MSPTRMEDERVSERLTGERINQKRQFNGGRDEILQSRNFKELFGSLFYYSKRWGFQRKTTSVMENKTTFALSIRMLCYFSVFYSMRFIHLCNYLFLFFKPHQSYNKRLKRSPAGLSSLIASWFSHLLPGLQVRGSDSSWPTMKGVRWVSHTPWGRQQRSWWKGRRVKKTGSTMSGRKKSDDSITLRSSLYWPSGHPSKSGTSTLVHRRLY